MKSLTFVLCLVVLGAHSLLVLAADCEDKSYKLNTGESYKPPDRCVKYTCMGLKQMVAESCPSLVAGLKPCKLESDVRKPYPECCPKFNC